MNNFSDNDLKQLAKNLMQEFAKQSKSFTEDDTRKSRYVDEEGNAISTKYRRYKKPDRMIKDLENLQSAMQYAANHWKHYKQDITRALPGSALRDAHEQYIKSITKMADEVNGHAGKMLKSYVHAIDLNKGNFDKQQEIFNEYTHYTELLKKLNVSTDKTNQTNDDKKSISKLHKSIENAALKLKKLGVITHKVNIKLNDKWDYEIKNKKVVEDILDNNKKMLENTRFYVTNLKELNDEELSARRKFISGLMAISADVTHKAMLTTIGRLKNLQTETQFAEAVKRGLSADEINEWMHLNRDSAYLLGKSANEYTKTVSNELRKFGLIGKEAADQLTRLNDLQMRIGVKPMTQSALELQKAASMLQIMEKITPEEAINKLTNAANNFTYTSLAADKTEAQRTKLLLNQTVTLKKIAMSTGFNAEYAEEMLQQTTNNRFQDVISKIKTQALMPLFLQGTEKYLNRGLTGEEKTALIKERQGAQTSDNEKAIILQLQKEIGVAFAKTSTMISDNIAKGNIGAATPYIVPEVAAREVGVDLKRLAEAGTAAKIKEDTTGLVAREQQYDMLVSQSMKSLSAIEDFYLKAYQVYNGLKISPGGAIAGALATGLVGYFKGAAGRGIMSKLGGSNAGKSAGGILGKIKDLFKIVKSPKLIPSVKSASRSVMNSAPSTVSKIAKTAVPMYIATGAIVGAYENYKTDTKDQYNRNESLIKDIKKLTSIDKFSNIKVFKNNETVAEINKIQTDLITRSIGIVEDIGNTLMLKSTNRVDLTDKTINAIQNQKNVKQAKIDFIEKTAKIEPKHVEIMTTGKVVDDDGNMLSDLQETMLRVLQKIEEHTDKTNNVLEENSIKQEQRHNNLLTQSKYESQTRNKYNQLALQTAETFNNNANLALSSIYQSVDDMFSN